MKITELHFSLSPSLQKPYRPKIPSAHSPISPNILNSSQATSCFKSHQSNKRLKYYSTRNKESNDVINDKNIQILKQQFKKFQDRNVRSIADSKQNSNKEIFNLIVKKYYKKNKFSNQFIDKKVKKQQSQSILQQKFTKISHQSPQIIKQDQFKSVNPQLNIQNENAQQYPCQKNQKLNIQKDHQQDFKHKQRGYSIPVTQKNVQRTIQVPQERLRRHRFNKSSITQLSHRNSFHKVNNFIVSREQSPKKVAEIEKNRFLKSSRSQRNKNPQAKRFIKMANTDLIQNQDGEKIDPYTQRQYLHVQLKAQNQKLKTLEKYLNISIIENNMTKSFLVKTITPQAGNGLNERVDRKYASMKQGFFKKAQSYSITSEKKRISQKLQNSKNKNDQLNGWEMSQKVFQDQYATII